METGSIFGGFMIAVLFGLFIVLHGLVHIWYVILAQKLVAFQPEMGWTGQSWILTTRLGDATTRFWASLFYSFAAISMVMSGVGVMLLSGWYRPALLSSILLSSIILLVFWDGSPDKIVQKGLLGFIINGLILTTMVMF
jgi:hypothetical protein